MLSYIHAELLKQKRTFDKKLVIIGPLIILLLCLLAPPWFQQNSHNWWYGFLYPGCLTLICAMVLQRDRGKLNYQNIYSLPVNLKNIWYSKIGAAAVLLAASNIIMMIFSILGGLVVVNFFRVPASISVSESVLAAFCIILCSLWEIPFCLWLSQKTGIWGTLFISLVLHILPGFEFATSNLWILCPYSWILRIMVPCLHMLPNGLPAAPGDLPTSLLMVFAALAASVILFVLLSILTARAFARKEVR